MKKIMAAAIVLVFAGATSSWALFGLQDVAFDGSLEYSGNSATNETDFNSANDKRGRTATRVRVGANMTVTEGVKGRLEFARSGKQFGRNFAGANGAGNTIDNETANILVHNAYVDIDDIFGLKMIRIGRQHVGEPGDLVWNISPTDDDSLTLNAIDGITFNGAWLEGKLGINVFTGKAAEDDGLTGTDAAGAVGDTNLTSVDVHLNEVIPGGRINIGLLAGDNQVGPTRADDNKLRTYRIGVRGGIQEDMFTYRAEFFQNAGSVNNGAPAGGGPAARELDYGGNAIDLGAGVNFNETEIGKFSLAVNVVIASGDDNLNDTDDDSFHDFSPLGINTSDRLFGEIFGKSNTLGGGGVPLGQGVNSANGAATNALTQGLGLQVFHIGGSYEPTWCENGWIKLDFYTFSRGEDSFVPVGGGAATVVGEDFGTEIDVTLGYDHSSNVGIELGYAILSVDDALTGLNPVSEEDIEKWFARAKIAWGGEEE